MAHTTDTLAAYYTPPEIAQILTDWAIKNASDTVLDPSFGGCSFLYASLKTKKKLGADRPGEQIFGVDIDPGAYGYLDLLLDAGAHPTQFITDDFFSVHPEQFSSALFSAVVGNPPYIRYHDIPSKLQERAAARLNEFGIQISGRASYWAFFLLYSMQFLRVGGRLAMILPGAILHTDYAAQVRTLFTDFFKRVTIILLRERVFEGTDEESVLVCASGAREGHETLNVIAVENTHALAQVVRNIDEDTGTLVQHLEGDGGWLRGLVEPATLEMYDELAQSSKALRLGNWVTTRIGVVTGHNNFFIISDEKQEHLGIPDKYLIPIIRRANHLKGVYVTDTDLIRFRENGNRYLLLTLRPDEDIPESIQTYLQFGEQLGVPKARKCSDRKAWYAVPHTFIPSAFMPIMSASWPRLVVNQSGYTCTNNILRLEWHEGKADHEWFLLSLGTLSSLSQLSAELVGRSYGGGVLKLEPRELAELVIPLLPQKYVGELTEKINTLLWHDRTREATDIVDAALVYSGVLTTQALILIRRTRDMLFLRRRYHRNDASKILGIEAI